MKQSAADRQTSILAALVGGLLLAMTFLGALALGAQDNSERGAFILRTRSDTLVIERFTRSATRLQSSVFIKGGPRLEYVAELGAFNSVGALELMQFAPNAKADDAPAARVRVTFRGDSAFAEVNGAMHRIKSSAGALPGVNNAIALFEQFTRRARSAGAGDIPYFALAGGVTLPVTVATQGTDTIVLTVAGQAQRLRVDAAGRILGGMLPAQQIEIIRVSEAAAATLALGKPDYSAPGNAPYTAEEVTLNGPGGITLGGTLTIPRNPAGKVPAIVTITGSGQEDRDEYIPVAGGYRPFRQIADTLGRRGIAVLRLDDRMVGASGGALGTSADYADDIRAGIAYLKTRKDIDGTRIGLVGHSEGGIIAPIVAATDASLKGIVLLAGPAYRGDTIIHFQLRNNVNHDASVPAAAKDSVYRAQLAAFEKSAQGSAWTKYFLTYDPIPTARRVKVPTLVLQGATDQQVTPEQAEKLGAAMRAGGNRDVTVRVFPEMNHLFIHDPDGNPAGYVRLPSNKVMPDVLGALADWLVLKLGAKSSM